MTLQTLLGDELCRWAGIDPQAVPVVQTELIASWDERPVLRVTIDMGEHIEAITKALHAVREAQP